MRIGTNRALWLFGLGQMLSTLGFVGARPRSSLTAAALAAVVVIENLTAGLGTAAFVGFMAALTDRRFTATQFALLTSLTGVPRTVVNATTGWIVAQTGWFNFFLLCTLLALPGMALLLRVAPWNERATEPPRP